MEYGFLRELVRETGTWRELLPIGPDTGLYDDRRSNNALETGFLYAHRIRRGQNVDELIKTICVRRLCALFVCTEVGKDDFSICDGR